MGKEAATSMFEAGSNLILLCLSQEQGRKLYEYLLQQYGLKIGR